MNPTRALVVVVATVAVMLSEYSRAEDQSTPNNPNELQMVVITAEKRAEDILKAPVSVSVFDRSEMEKRAIVDLADIAEITPGVDYQNLGGVDHIAIRGITTNTNAQEYATVGLYIDDTPIQVRTSNLINLYGNSQPKVFDLERVEVLRGPQGTLYGAGAEGGAIRFITPQPSLTSSSGYARANIGMTSGGGPSYEAGVAYGAPIVTDELGFRVSAWYRRDGGYVQYDSPLGGYKADNGNWSNSSVVRAALTWSPAAWIKITPSYFYQDVFINNINSFEPATSLESNDFFTNHWGVLNPQFSNPGNGYFVNPSTVQTPADDNFSIPALKVEFDFDNVVLSSNTAYMYRKSDLINDFTPFAQNFYGISGWTTLPGAVVGDRNYISTVQNVFTQEVRLQNIDTGTTRLVWTLGLYYSNARQRVINTETNPYIPNIIQNATGMTIEQVTGFPLIQPGNIEYYGNEPGKDEQSAVFGQGTYRLSNQWSVVAGVRVARESNDYSAYQAGPEIFTAPFTFGGSESQTVVDPKFGVNYQVTPDNLVYISAGKGDRIGGVNAALELGEACTEALAALGGANGTFKSDYLWSYELGTKDKLADGRANIEGSVFYIDWHDVQYAVPVPACANSFVTNLGAATSYGFDFQATTLVGENFEFGLALGYTHATISKAIPLTGSTKFAAIEGDQLNPYAAPWLVSPTAQYSISMGEGYRGYVRVDDVFHSKNPGPFAQDNPVSVSYNAIAFQPNPSYNVLNLHVGVTTDRWDASVFALNVANTHPILYANQYQSVQPLGAAFTLTPLTFGLQGVYRW